MRLFEQQLACGGQLHPARCAVEQLHAQVFFPLLNLAGQRGPGKMQANGRAADIFCLGNDDELAKMTKVHQAGLLWGNRERSVQRGWAKGSGTAHLPARAMFHSRDRNKRSR